MISKILLKQGLFLCAWYFDIVFLNVRGHKKEKSADNNRRIYPHLLYIFISLIFSLKPMEFNDTRWIFLR